MTILEDGSCLHQYYCEQCKKNKDKIYEPFPVFITSKRVNMLDCGSGHLITNTAHYYKHPIKGYWIYSEECLHD